MIIKNCGMQLIDTSVHIHLKAIKIIFILREKIFNLAKHYLLTIF